MTRHEKLSQIELRASSASHLAWFLAVVEPVDMQTNRTLKQLRVALTDALRLLDAVEEDAA